LWHGGGGDGCVQNAPLFYNPLVTRVSEGRGRMDRKQEITGEVIGMNLFRQREESLLLLKVRDFIVDGRVVDLRRVNELMGGGITQNACWEIWRALNKLLLVRKNRILVEVKSWREVLGLPFKGSKIFRRILEKNSRANKADWLCDKFAMNIGQQKPQWSTYGGWCGFWNISHLPVSVRLFAFQLINNSLPVKARLTHRNRHIGIDESCDFCATGYEVKNRETFKHVFF